MSQFTFPSATNRDHISLSSSINTILPTTKKGPLNEVINNSIKDDVDNTLAGVPIMIEIQCLIDKSSTITWMTIKDSFNMKELPKDIEYMEVYVNVMKSRFPKVSCMYPSLPSDDAIRWILQGLYTKKMVLNIVSG